MPGHPFLFINSFINLRGPESVSNILRLQIHIAAMHLHAAVATGFHGYIDPYALARPLGQRRVSQVVEDKLLDPCLFERLFDLAANQATRDRRPVAQGKNEVLQVRDNTSGFPLVFYLFDDLAGQREPERYQQYCRLVLEE
jgi:hypothetical protein